MNLKEQRAAALAAAQGIIKKAKDANVDLTAEEQVEVEAKFAEIDELDKKIKAAEKSDGLMARIANLGGDGEDDGDKPAAKSLGEHFVKSVGAEGLARVKAHSGLSVSAPEFKAATDTQVTTGLPSVLLTDVDRNFVHGYRPRAVVADLLGSGTLTGNAVTYFTEGSLEGDFTTVAEGGQKPQLHVTDPTPVTDALKKIAAWWDMSDEMVEDAGFMVSEINNTGLYRLSMFEEQQILSGAGTGTTVKGLLNRSGIQTEARGTTASGDTAADTLFRAITKVQTGSGFSADGIVINPADYQDLRLAKDANDQYYGGGFFAGQYGVGGVLEQPPLWGLRTIVTTAVAADTAVVGAFGVAATLYRKGGIRVESTNSDQGKFTTNVITTRIEERVALAVRVPKAIVKVTLTPSA
jgi:HK97 family phage major capsid protein